MKYKADWPEAAERWAALWEGRRLDRPCMVVTAPNGKPRRVAPPVSGEQKFLDPDWNVRAAREYAETTCFAGEAVPSWLLNAGWLATGYHARPRLSLETIWFEPASIDWDNPPSFELDFANPWFRRYQALHQAFLGLAGRDDLMVGQVCLLPASDILARLMGTEAFMLALIEHREWMRATLRKLTENWLRVMAYFAELTAKSNAFPYGIAGWACFWGPEPFLATQSDVSCMISPEMFEEFVVPELERVGREFGRVWYHLDGPGAERHLPRLCSIDAIRVIQWVPGAGRPPNGPAYLDLYRAIQAAGKVVHIQAPKENVEVVIEALDPARLCIETWCGSTREAEELLADARRWGAAKKCR